ncbi:integrase [Micromonospora sp. NPDC023888]|uniref:integrase n=1 Tax=Micromonospora sp. NPDC023888 TaxID=3155607 RepID=UPI0033EC7E4E
MRTRLRRIWIDGRPFVWRAVIHCVPGSGDCHRGIRVRAWGAGKTSRKLEVDLLSITGPSKWDACATDDSYPTGADVRAVISYALENGWQPEQRGGTFVLSEREHGARFSLPGFLLVDPVRTAESADPTAQVTRAYQARQRG